MEKILSICIPVFNGGEALFWHVKEILTYENNDIEVVISDNASTDNTLELLQTINDNRLKIITHKKNKGPFYNWYIVLMHGAGKYLMLHQDNDKLVVKNLPQYLNFLKNVQYDVMRNTSGIYKGETGELTVAQVQFYNVLYGHAGNVVYLRDALHSIKPLCCSFDPNYTSYPYSIWDTQILMKYPLDAKKAYMNGDITIKYSPKTYKDKESRTRLYTEIGCLPYSYENVANTFAKYIKVLRYLYPEDKEFYRLLCNAYRINLYMATSHFYQIMKIPESKWMKRRYNLDSLDNKKIDYVKLNDDFYNSTVSILNVYSPIWRIITTACLKIITIYNKNTFLLSYCSKKMGMKQKWIRTQLDKLLKLLIERICK